MTFQEYQEFFESILSKSTGVQVAPYNDPEYLEYTKLNWSRMNRWLKTGKLSEEIKSIVKNINQPQHWIIITEPWCGDAAHCVPFIELLSRENPLITTVYELRDSEPFRIEQYLTNGTKSIPKLIIRNDKNTDLAVWGPRPVACQSVHDRLKKENVPLDKIKVEIQNWYNENKGVEIQNELMLKIQGTTSVH